MPIIKSAKKRVRQTKSAAIRNSKTRRSLREALKSLQTSLKANDTKKVKTDFSRSQSALDTSVKKGLIHKNKAARKKKQLSAQIKAAGIKFSKTSPKVAKKPAPKTKKTD